MKHKFATFINFICSFDRSRVNKMDNFFQIVKIRSVWIVFMLVSSMGTLKNIRFVWIVLVLIQNVLSTNDNTGNDASKDAKTIIDSKFDTKTIENILLYRTQEECININKAINAAGGKPIVDPKYIPLQNTKPYDDLLFALVSDSMTVFSMYLGQYLDRKDETSIIQIFMQADNDREKLKEVYGNQHDHKFDDARRKQRHPFANALAVWSERNRDPEKTGCIIDSCVVGQNLEDERPLWDKKTRNQLEYVLMKESLKDSRSSVECYGTIWGDRPNRNFIKDITDGIKNHDLVDLYTSLIRYVRNGDLYLAQVLHDHCNDQDNWSLWIIILTTRRGDPMTAIDQAFQNEYKNVTLKDYIKTCNVQDSQLKEMLTVLVDPSTVSKRQPPPPPPPSPPSLPPASALGSGNFYPSEAGDTGSTLDTPSSPMG